VFFLLFGGTTLSVLSRRRLAVATGLVVVSARRPAAIAGTL